jgi:hypothetical protein
MSRRFDYEFRGIERVVVIDSYDVDYDTNALDFSWHFDGVTPAEHDALAITEEEEESICTELIERVEGGYDDD